jgi:hypothetical protein
MRVAGPEVQREPAALVDVVAAVLQRAGDRHHRQLLEEVVEAGLHLGATALQEVLEHLGDGGVHLELGQRD